MRVTHTPMTDNRTLRRAYIVASLILIAGIGVMFLLSKNTTQQQIVVYRDSVTDPRHTDTRQGTASRTPTTREDQPTARPSAISPAETHQPEQASTTKQELNRNHKNIIIELNTADTLTLQLLRGIGPTFARRIVAYRNRLGGFVSKEQLLEVYGFDEERYNAIATQVTVSTDSISKIPINQVTIKRLARHPYLDPYQARDIIAYRSKGHKYTCPQDLLLVTTIDEKTLHKIEAYLSFD